MIFLFLGSGCVECDTHKPVTPQVFCALRGRLWLFLDGGRCGIREAPPLVAWSATEIWPNPITHSTPLRTVSTTLNASRRAVLCADALARMLLAPLLDHSRTSPIPFARRWRRSFPHPLFLFFTCTTSQTQQSAICVITIHQNAAFGSQNQTRMKPFIVLFDQTQLSRYMCFRMLFRPPVTLAIALRAWHKHGSEADETMKRLTGNRLICKDLVWFATQNPAGCLTLLLKFLCCFRLSQNPSLMLAKSPPACSK